MEELIKALKLISKYESKDLYELAKDFAWYSNQAIPTKVLQDFKLTGLSNIDFLISDFLNKYGLKNLLQVCSKD